MSAYPVPDPTSVAELAEPISSAAMMEDDSGFEADVEADPVPTPRPRNRAVAQPLRLDSSLSVVCYKYEQGRPDPAQITASSSSGRWQGRRAHMHYYLPENWSPSYKFTVFEDSYILSIARDAEAYSPERFAPSQPPFPPPPPHAASAAYHLARPLHGALSSGSSASPAQAEFELVWPVELDDTLLDAVESACDRVVLGAKRKPHSAISLNGVNLKLQRMNV